VYEFQPPSERGLDAVCAIKAMNDGTAKVFVPLGENLFIRDPEAYTDDALALCRVTVDIYETKQGLSSYRRSSICSFPPWTNRSRYSKRIAAIRHDGTRAQDRRQEQYPHLEIYWRDNSDL